MALPHTFLELIDRAGITGNEKQEYARRIHVILHNVYEKGRKVGFDEGYEKGMDDTFEVARDQSELIDEAKKLDWAEGM
jgi:flagellar biosynthesis/type III secretory pathway protein FliH